MSPQGTFKSTTPVSKISGEPLRPETHFTVVIQPLVPNQTSYGTNTQTGRNSLISPSHFQLDHKQLGDYRSA